MAKVECSKVTVLNTGNKIYTLFDSTLNPDRIVLWIATATDESSAGYSDLTTKFTGSAKYSDENNSYTITHYRNIGGVKTKTFEANVTGFDTGEWHLNVSTCTQTTTLNYVVYEA